MLSLLLLVLPALGADAPEISRSVGKPDGVVVMWPRVVPRTDDDGILKIAGELQRHLVALAEKTAVVDVRPQPERVCPQPRGCRGAVLGAVLAHGGGGCVAVALVSPPGPSEQTLVPWAGNLELSETTAPFREPPESRISVHDFVPCAELVGRLEQGDARITQALGAAR